MQKISFLPLAVCLGLTGCSQPNSPWSTVRAVRVDTRDSGDPSAAYAEHLSGVLKTAHVQHKIVTYEYRYHTAFREEAIGTRTAVIYRDDKNPNNPWWLMDDQLFNPVWLPGEDENRQVSFYLHRPATVVSTKTIDDSDGKRTIAAPDEFESRGTMVARLQPVGKTERSFRWPHWFGKRSESRLLADTKVRKQPMFRQGSSTAPALSVPSESRLASVFRLRHGTAFDPASETDRRKMEEMLLTAGTRSAKLF